MGMLMAEGKLAVRTSYRRYRLMYLFDRARLIFTQSGALMRPELDEKEAKKVASLLVGSGVTTVVINACRSAAGSNEASNIACTLVRNGIKTAIGMAFNVLSLSADQFMKDFYYHYFVQTALPIQAVSYARGELRRDSSRMSKYHTKVNLEDHLVPIIHCQESETLNFLHHSSEQMSKTHRKNVHPTPSNLLGREGDILKLEWMLSQFGRHTVHLQGQPGIGKTSILMEATAWWQKTGLFQQVIYIQLADSQFRNCTTEIILTSIAKQANKISENLSSAALLAAMNDHSFLLIIDSLDSIEWSSSLPTLTHERQLRMFLKKLKNCPIIISSRTSDLWLYATIQSWILLEPVDFSNAIAIGTGILQKIRLSSKLLVTQDDQSYFEQLITMSQGNPLAIKVMMYDLAKRFGEDSSMTLESHLMSLLQLRPVLIDVENLSHEGGARAIAELLEWVYEDTRTDLELYHFEEMPTPTDHPFIIPMESLESLSLSIRTIKQRGGPSLNSMARRLRRDRKLAKSGFHTAMILNGFWHNIIYQIEPFVTTLAALVVARQFLEDDAFVKFRTRLCEYTDESGQKSNYVYDILGGTSAFGLSPLVANYCLYAATNALAKVYQSLSEDLYHFVNGPFRREYGNTLHYFNESYYSVNPLVSLVSQSSIVRALYPQNLAHDIEIARDSLYRHRMSVWLNYKANIPSSPYCDALKAELDFDFYNYLCLMLSFQKLDSWPVALHWNFQYLIFFAATSNPRRLRIVERALNRFISRALPLIRNLRQKYHDPKVGGYETASQDKNGTDWSMVTDLEVACTTALLRAMTCKELLQKPYNKYLSQWNYVKARPMFLHWKCMDLTLRELLYKTLVLNTRWFETVQDGGKSLQVATAEDIMNGVTELTNLQRRYLNLTSPVHTADTSLTVPAQIAEYMFAAMSMQDFPLSRANKMLNRLAGEIANAGGETLTKVVQDLEKLLLEEVEHNNSVPTRLQLHTYLALVHNGIGNKVIAMQHRTIKEELKSMLEPEVAEKIEKSSKIWTSYWRDSRRIKGEPVNEAQIFERQLDERRAKLSAAEAEDPQDELNILSCVEAIADTLRDLGRDAAAAEHYERVIQGRQWLLPANDKGTLLAIFARSKLLGNLHRFDESIQNLRMLQKGYAGLGDQKVHHNVTGSLGLHILNSIKWSGNSLAESTQQTLLLEAKALLEAGVETAEELFELGDINISHSFSNLASLHAYNKKYNEAEACYKSAIRMYLTRTSTEADPGLIKSRNNLACLWSEMHKFKEAEDLYSHLLKICYDHYEVWHKMTILVLSNFYDLYEKMGATAKAKMFIQEYVSISQKSLDDTIRADKQGTFDVKYAKYQIGRTLAACDSYEEAILLLEEVAVVWREQQKRDHEVLELLDKLRHCYSTQKSPQLQQEYDTCTELIQLQRDLNGPQHADTLIAIERQVICLRRMNRIEEAMDMQLQLIEARKASQGMSSERILNNISYLAEIYEEMEDWPAALKARREVYEFSKGLDPNSPKTIHQASRIAILYENLLEWERVVDFRKNEVKAWRKIEGLNGENALLALVEVGFGLERLGKYDEAKSVIDEAIKGRSKVLGPNHFGTLQALRLKAIICRGLKEIDESEKILNEVLSTRARYPMEDDTCCLALAGLSKVYKARGQPDRALELLRKAVNVSEESQGEQHVKRPEDLLLELAKEYAAVLRWDEAKKAVDQALLKLRSQKATRAVSRNIEECISLLGEISGRTYQDENETARAQL